MLTVPEAAKILGLSEGRTRILAEKGQLKADKVGRQWLIHERSVEDRMKSAPKPGRPKTSQTNPPQTPGIDASAAYTLYRECTQTFSSGVDLNLIAQARTPEERAFYVTMTNFFLGQKCADLVKQGVY